MVLFNKKSLKCYSIFKLFEKIDQTLTSFFIFGLIHRNYFQIGLFMVRFSSVWAKKKIKPKYVNFKKYDLNRTENQFKLNQFGSIKISFLG